MPCRAGCGLGSDLVANLCSFFSTKMASENLDAATATAVQETATTEMSTQDVAVEKLNASEQVPVADEAATTTAESAAPGAQVAPAAEEPAAAVQATEVSSSPKRASLLDKFRFKKPSASPSTDSHEPIASETVAPIEKKDEPVKKAFTFKLPFKKAQAVDQHVDETVVVETAVTDTTTVVADTIAETTQAIAEVSGVPPAAEAEKTEIVASEPEVIETKDEGVVAVIIAAEEVKEETSSPSKAKKSFPFKLPFAKKEKAGPSSSEAVIQVEEVVVDATMTFDEAVANEVNDAQEAVPPQVEVAAEGKKKTVFSNFGTLLRQAASNPGTEKKKEKATVPDAMEVKVAEVAATEIDAAATATSSSATVEDAVTEAEKIEEVMPTAITEEKKDSVFANLSRKLHFKKAERAGSLSKGETVSPVTEEAEAKVEDSVPAIVTEALATDEPKEKKLLGFVRSLSLPKLRPIDGASTSTADGASTSAAVDMQAEAEVALVENTGAEATVSAKTPEKKKFSLLSFVKRPSSPKGVAAATVEKAEVVMVEVENKTEAVNQEKIVVPGIEKKEEVIVGAEEKAVEVVGAAST
ncbi:hypothetical protein BC830DRAFT_1108626 [Chytriomyces sp. MP71]|nr:hypothetical protein BC830DRAFT_1108626 [Chytriomyces sp. MP71]